MSIQEFIEKGGTYVFDPAETTQAPDEILANYGNFIDSICIVAKSEVGSSYYPSSTAPKDPRFGDIFSSFSQLASDIGIQVYAMVHGNIDGFFSRDANFQMHRSGGTKIEGYVCPSQDIYWQYLAEVVAEITAQREIEGIILKDVLYPRDLSCFCENCRRKFSTKNNIDRDFSLEQIQKRANIYANWQNDRIEALRSTISTVVNRVHKEKNIEILSEVLLDPQTNYLEGAKEHFAQDINMISQITPHLLLHLHPWSALPTNKAELAQVKERLSSIENRLETSKNSLFVWDVNSENFDMMVELKDAYSSSNIFFTDYQPSSYLNRRTLHLNLGV
ncbi:MAG: hypothetical protein ACXAC2_05550 [Candidatus Kariarchaeaceae archaeon]|jgi:hypothetical protein